MRKRQKSKIVALLCVAALGASIIPTNVLAMPEQSDVARTAESVYGENAEGVLIPQFMITPEVSSEETVSDRCYGRYALDGDSSTMWHTKWSGDGAKAPHWIILDLGKEYPVSKLYYLPRQSDGTNGMITRYKISGSVDGSNFFEIATGTWKTTTEEKTAAFSPVKVRYIRLEGNDTFASCSELNIETTDLTCKDLWECLKEAEHRLKASEVGDTVGQYPEEAYKAFEAAIADARTSAANPNLDAEELGNALETLQKAMEDFEKQKNLYQKEALEKLLTEAETLYSNTEAGAGEGQVPQSAKEELKQSIDAAKVIMEQEKGAEEIHEGYLQLKEALNKFRDCIVSDVKSLAGTWELKLGAYDADDGEYEETCILPGTLDENRKGDKSTALNTNKLNRKYTYTGSAVYQKKVNIPENWRDKSVSLLLERTKMTRVWVNGREQTECNANSALGVSQVYQIKDFIPGTENVITIQVTNTGYPIGTGSHMLTEETVTNWNGIIGNIELKAEDKMALDEMRIYPNVEEKSAALKINISNKEHVTGSAVIEITGESYNHSGAAHKVAAQSFPLELNGEEAQEIELTVDMGENVKLWSEFEPALYHMSASLKCGETVNEKTESFGMREFAYKERKFTINGIKTFMRGEGNSAVFPLTGYPYMTKEEWLTFFGKAQELGINFFRFHSWTPPEAAFEAADELGIYMQPELYAFGGAPFKPNGSDTTSSDYYKAEAVRILHSLANHPSFVMMAWGNELDTVSSDNRKYANQLRDVCRQADNTRLYSEGSNNNYWNPTFNEGDDYWTTCKTHSTAQKDHIRISFSWADDSKGGTIETLSPNTTHTYDAALSGYEKPIMNHEAGQYQVLPNFDKEIPKYDSGIFEARNLKYYRDLMEEKGLLDMNETFSRVSARVSAIGYRADLETALRSENLAGYQLLSIQDFPGQGTAHVGILDNFMEDKEGGFSKEEYKNFNQETVVLGELPQLVFTNAQTLKAKAVISNYSVSEIKDADIYWILRDGEKVVASGELAAKTAVQGGVTKMGEIVCELSSVKEAAKLSLEIGSEKVGNSNSYDIWVYPETISTEIPEGITVAEKFDEKTKQILEEGGKVLLLPTPNAKVLPESTGVRWTTDYWSKMFHRSDRDAHTMGMYIQNEHPVFKNFPTEYFNDYQWFHLMKGSRAMIMDNLPAEIKPLAWNIDHMEWSRKLGSLFEVNVGKGKAMICTFDLKNQIEQYPEAKQLYRSILDYMESDEFQPEADVTIQALESVIMEEVDYIDAYKKIEAENYSEATSGVRQESGIEEGSSEKQTALGGITKSTKLKYQKVNFGTQGADKIIINGSNANDYSEFIKVYNDATNQLIARLEFKPTPKGWSTYCSQEFSIPRLAGMQNLRFEFEKGALAFNYFKFTQVKETYMNPYELLNPESVAADIEITNGENGSHRVMQNYVSEITNQVSVQFNRSDFGNNGSNQVIIKGRTLSNNDVSGRIKYVDEKGAAQEIPFVFEAGKGESYELSSEVFYMQTLHAAGIKGVQNLIVEFEEGTRFDFEALIFTEACELPKEYTEALKNAEEIFRLLENKPLYYSKDSVNELKTVYEEAVGAGRDSTEALQKIAAKLQEKINALEFTGKSKSAYTITYARNYDKANGNGVHLERQEDQVVGGFDKGETLVFSGIDFGDKSAVRLTLRGANGRSEQDQESVAKMGVWYGEKEDQYVTIELPVTGGWGADNDQDVTITLPQNVFKGTKDIKIKLIEGAIALHSFTFEEAEDYLYTVTVDGAVKGNAYQYNDKVAIEAPAAPEAGQVFAGWEVDGKMISTDADYTFYVSNDIEINSVFADEAAVIEMKAEAVLTNVFAIDREDEKSDIRFVGQLLIPEGYELVNAGLVWSTKDLAVLELGSGLKPTYIKAISDTNQFSVTIKGLPEGKFLRGRIFMTIRDRKTGKEQVLYSQEEKKVSAGK